MGDVSVTITYFLLSDNKNQKHVNEKSFIQDSALLEYMEAQRVEEKQTDKGYRFTVFVLVDWHLTVQYILMLVAAYEYLQSNHFSTVDWLLHITGASFHRWQKDATMAVFWGRLFVISHLMLTCKLLRARVTIADDSFVLSPQRLLMLWFFSENPSSSETQVRDTEKKHPQASGPWTSGQSASWGTFWPKQMLLFWKWAWACLEIMVSVSCMLLMIY